MARIYFILALLSSPAYAAEPFAPPQGCTSFLAVQSRMCSVSHYYRCQQDAAGDTWRADFNDKGQTYLGHINAEGEWLESYTFTGGGGVQALISGGSDPAQISELLSKGTDSFSFSLQGNDGSISDINGFDRLTGEKEDIDGVTLLHTEFAFSETNAEDGSVLSAARGQQFVHPEWRLFFMGKADWSEDGVSFTAFDDRPMTFVFPEEVGFTSTQPIFGCTPQMTRYAPNHLDNLGDPRNDNL